MNRREFLRLAGGAGAGILIGSLGAARDRSTAFSEEGLKVSVRGGFVNLNGTGRIVIRALSLAPEIKIYAVGGAPRKMAVGISNVRARQMELKGDAAEKVSVGETSLEAEFALPGGGVTTIRTEYKRLPGERLNFIAFSDTHLGDDAAEEHFARVLRHTNLRLPTFAVDAGDVVDVDEPAQWNVANERFKGLKVPLFTTIGNHDSYLSTKLYRKHMGDLFYEFMIEGTQFLFLDNSQKYNKATLYMDGAKPEEQWDWLVERLKAPAAHRIVFFHFPVYGNRSMLDPMYLQSTPPEKRKEEVERMVKLFRESGVEYVCFGHLHSPAREVIDGITHLRLGGGGGSRASETDDRSVSFAHFFIDEQGIRDYTVYLYYEPGEVERIEFCEARARLPVGAREPLVAHGVARDGRLLGIEADYKIVSGPGRIEDRVVYVADEPGRAGIEARYAEYFAGREIHVA